jgi:hypothetical protein
MLYGYELVAFATSLTDFWHPYGFFRSCLLGLRGAWEITEQSAGSDSSNPPDLAFSIDPLLWSLARHRP